MIFLHEIDWKIKMNNRHISHMLLATLKLVSCLKNYCYHHRDNRYIVKLLCLPQSLYKHVLTEFEYQLQLEFDICIQSTINYKYPNEFWYKVMIFQSNTVRWKYKYMTAPPITIYWQFLKQTLCCIIPLFHEYAVSDWNDVPVLLCHMWLCHLISQINISAGYLSLVSDKSWKLCQ